MGEAEHPTAEHGVVERPELTAQADGGRQLDRLDQNQVGLDPGLLQRGGTEVDTGRCGRLQHALGDAAELSVRRVELLRELDDRPPDRKAALRVPRHPEVRSCGVLACLEELVVLADQLLRHIADRAGTHRMLVPQPDDRVDPAASRIGIHPGWYRVARIEVPWQMRHVLAQLLEDPFLVVLGVEGGHRRTQLVTVIFEEASMAAPSSLRRQTDVDLDRELAAGALLGGVQFEQAVLVDGHQVSPRSCRPLVDGLRGYAGDEPGAVAQRVVGCEVLARHLPGLLVQRDLDGVLVMAQRARGRPAVAGGPLVVGEGEMLHELGRVGLRAPHPHPEGLGQDALGLLLGQCHDGGLGKAVLLSHVLEDLCRFRGPLRRGLGVARWPPAACGRPPGTARRSPRPSRPPDRDRAAWAPTEFLGEPSRHHRHVRRTSDEQHLVDLRSRLLGLQRRQGAAHDLDAAVEQVGRHLLELGAAHLDLGGGPRELQHDRSTSRAATAASSRPRL